ncbi:HEPN domain-containing protein [Amycolatopsis sp. WAC 04197]|uniref:HEPN domain-containing protein n=1 Tax=Amycolatopsis sp. WAC 04197 TaxID=2203199 RepID=UPI000F76877D|nr:HEPN domain-containing protein [Amycolatopsis sp. WAC 04197]
MKIPRVDTTFADCGDHLEEARAHGTEIEAILTRYVCAVIYGAFERELRKIVKARGEGDGSDRQLNNFVEFAATRLIRSIKISEIAGIAGHFSADCKKAFQANLDHEAAAAWDVLINNRHDVAHDNTSASGETVSTITFDEAKTLYSKALTVLDTFSDSIKKP